MLGKKIQDIKEPLLDETGKSTEYEGGEQG